MSIGAIAGCSIRIRLVIGGAESAVDNRGASAASGVPFSASVAESGNFCFRKFVAAVVKEKVYTQIIVWNGESSSA